RKILQKRKEEIEQEKTRLAIEQEQKQQVEPAGRQANSECHSRACPAARWKNGNLFVPGCRFPIRSGMTAGTGMTTQKVTHYVPAKIKKIIKEEHGTKCSAPGCTKPAKILHHTARFAITQNHNPRFLAPLCEAHHELAHKIDLRYATCART
ncbi:MAG: hypothetical protein WC285_05310, partial [Candidatus Gracilibacteria bacterium]